MYATLPETEGKTLEEIELHFSDNSKKITDRNIKKVAKDIQIKSNSTTGDVKPQTVFKVQGGCDNKGFAVETINC